MARSGSGAVLYGTVSPKRVYASGTRSPRARARARSSRRAQQARRDPAASRARRWRLFDNGFRAVAGPGRTLARAASGHSASTCHEVACLEGKMIRGRPWGFRAPSAIGRLITTVMKWYRLLRYEQCFLSWIASARKASLALVALLPVVVGCDKDDGTSSDTDTAANTDSTDATTNNNTMTAPTTTDGTDTTDDTDDTDTAPTTTGVGRRRLRDGHPDDLGRRVARPVVTSAGGTAASWFVITPGDFARRARRQNALELQTMQLIAPGRSRGELPAAQDQQHAHRGWRVAARHAAAASRQR